MTIRERGKIANVLRRELVIPFDVFRTHWRTERMKDVSAKSIMIRIFFFEKVLNLEGFEMVSTCGKAEGRTKISKSVKGFWTYRFVCGDSTRQKIAVINAERSNHALDGQAVHDEDQTSRIMQNVSKVLSFGQVMIADDEVDNTERLDIEETEDNRKDESKEVAVVALADAISNPGAVVIEVFYAVIAHTAVDCSHGPIEIASI